MSAWVEGFILLEDKRFERAASTVVKVEFRPSTSHPGWCRTRDTTFGCGYLVPEENVALTIPALYEQRKRKEVKFRKDDSIIPITLIGKRKVERK